MQISNTVLCIEFCTLFMKVSQVLQLILRERTQRQGLFTNLNQFLLDYNIKEMDSQSQFNNSNDGIQSEQIYKIPKKQMNYQNSINSGPWDDIQNLNYIAFIQKNREYLTSKSKRRNGKIFKQMALFLGTRNAIQCRSHHQKQLQKHKNITKILTVFKQNFSNDQYIHRLSSINPIQLEIESKKISRKTQKPDKSHQQFPNVSIKSQEKELNQNVDNSQRLLMKESKFCQLYKDFQNISSLPINYTSYNPYTLGYFYYWPYQIPVNNNDIFRS